jgi:hypothetical protein
VTEGSVAAAVIAAEASKLCWTSIFVVFMRIRVSWVYVSGGRLRRSRHVGCLDCGRCCRGRASLGTACGYCAGEVVCGKQEPQAVEEGGHHGGREDGSLAQLAEERREANKAIADAQAAQAEAKVARAEGSLARQRAEELEARFNALRSRVDKAESSTRAEVERTHAQFVDAYRELGARTADFEVPGQEAGLRFLEWLQEELLVLPTIVTGFMSFASLVTCEGAMNALSREGCRHYEVFNQADENFEREIFKVEDPVVKQSAGHSSIGCGVRTVVRRSGIGPTGR